MENINNIVFAKNLKKCIDDSGKSRKDIAKALNVPYSTFSDWVNGKKFPRIDKIEKLADYFGVAKSDLIESHEFDNVNGNNSFIATSVLHMQSDPAFLEAVISLSKLSDDKLEIARRLLDALDKQS